MMAFGAGSLLFAVTVELYGHALRELQDNPHMTKGEMMVICVGAICGAMIYLYINRWLEDVLVEDTEVLDEINYEMTHRLSTIVDESPREDGTEPVPKAPAKRSSFSKSMRGPRTSATGSILSLGSHPEDHLGSPHLGVPPPWRNQRASVCEMMHIMSEITHEKPGHAEVSEEEAQKAKQVALSLFVGMLVDGIPEGFLMGFLAAEDHLSPVFIVSLFVANFPEAFASSSLLIQAEYSTPMIVSMWGALCFMVAALGALSSGVLLAVYPNYGPHAYLPLEVRIGANLVEGLTGGAMIACISSVMLPEAFERAGKGGSLWMSSGFLCTCGFLMAVALKVLEV